MALMQATRTVPGVFRERAARFGDRPFIHFHGGDEWQALSWAEAGERVERIAAHLVELGVQPGQSVALLAPNRYEWILADWAIQAVGGITVPIYPTSTPRIVNYILSDSKSVLVLAADHTLAAKVESGGDSPRIVEMDADFAPWMANEVAPELRAEVDRRAAGIEPDAIATIIYTSGTTGDPKGVVLHHGAFVEMAERTLSVFPVAESDVILSWMPYSHVFERMDGVFLPMFAGATLWLTRGTEHLIEDIKIVRPTLMMGVPRIWEKVYEAVYDNIHHGPAAQRRLFEWAVAIGRRRLAGEHGTILDVEESLADRLVLNPLRLRLFGDRLRCFMSGGAPLNEKVEEFFWVIGVKLMQGWGLTETLSAATTNTEAVHRYRTVGKAIPGVEIRIAEDGEILVKGPCVMAGYWNRPEATADTFVDGWFKTGDLGFLDADGFLSITDRKKDLIKTSGGKYVAPLPIEAKLETDRYVAASMLVGDGRPYVVALIVPDFKALAADEHISGDPEVLVHDPRLQAFFQERVDAVNRDLSSFETIKYFTLLPREFNEAEGEVTPTLKTKRRVVAEHFADLIEEMYRRPRPI